ncbi:MAG: MFS transporter, partial [Novosphingobium sp.]
IALGVVEAVIMTVATALIGDYFEGAQREKWIALQVAVGSIAAIALIAIGGALGDALGSRGPFLLYLLALPVVLAAALVLFEPVRQSQATEPGRSASVLSAIAPLVVTTLGIGVLFYTMIVQLGPILERSGAVSPGVIGMIGAGTNLGVALGTIVFNRFKEKAGHTLLLAGLAIAAIGYACTGLSSQLAVISVFAVLTCIGSGILLPNMLAWTMRRLPTEQRGRGMGLWTGAFFLGQFLAPLVIAGIQQASGTMSNALLVYAGVAGVAAIGVAFIGSRKTV